MASKLVLVSNDTKPNSSHYRQSGDKPNIPYIVLECLVLDAYCSTMSHAYSSIPVQNLTKKNRTLTG